MATRSPLDPAPAPAEKQEGTRVTFLPSTDTSRTHRIIWDNPRHRSANSLPHFGCATCSHRRAARGEKRSNCCTNAASRLLRSRSGQDGDRASPLAITGQRDEAGVDGRAEWIQYTSRSCFNNNIPQRDGVNPPAAFRAALTRPLNNYSEIRRDEEVEGSLTGDYMRAGLTRSSRSSGPIPSCSSQTTDKL